MGQKSQEERRAILKARVPVKVLDSLDGPVEVFVNPPDGNVLNYVIYVRYDLQLLILELNAKGDTWNLIESAHGLFRSAQVDPYSPWYVTSDGLIVVRTNNEFRFYRIVDNKLKECWNHLTDTGYDQILLGNFYKNGSIVNALVRSENEIKFLSLRSSQPTWNVQVVVLTSEWLHPESRISLTADFVDSGQDVFLLRTIKGLHIFKFISSEKLELIATCESITLPDKSSFDRIMFAKFSAFEYKEMLHFSYSGLNVYRFDKTSKSFTWLYYSTVFSEYHNWNVNYINSIFARDLNGDGIDELISTGPSGFKTFQAVSNDAEFSLDDIPFKSTDNTHRYATLKTVLPKFKNEVPQVVVLIENKLLTIAVDNDTENVVQIPENKPRQVDSQPISLVLPETQYTRWLHEQLDLSELLQPINALTGKIELSLPLIQLDNPFGISVRKIFQYRDVVRQKLLGRGWSFSLDYISVDHRGSLFEEDFRYAIVKQNNQVQLTRVAGNASDGYNIFKIQNCDTLEMKYYKDDQRWEMTNKKSAMTFFFGRHNKTEAIQYQKEGDNKTIPLTWYLVREELQSGSFVDYRYNFPEDGDVQMMKIATDTNSSVSFKYDNHRLEKFTVLTENYQQNINLKCGSYDDQQETEYLLQINQDDRVIFEFQYAETSKLMNEIVYPNGLKTKLEYTAITIDQIQFNTPVAMNVEDFNLYYGPDYSVFADKSGDGQFLNVRIRDLLGGMNSNKARREMISIGNLKIVAHQIYTLENLLGVVLVYAEEQQLHIYHFTSDKWTYTTHLRLSNDTVVKASTNTIYVLNNQSLTTIFIDCNSTLQTSQQPAEVPENFILQVTPNGDLMYKDDSVLQLRHEDGNCGWISYTINAEAGLVKQMRNVIDQFKLDEKPKKDLIRALKLDMIQFYNNFIVFRTLEIQNSQLIIRLVLKQLDSKHKVTLDDNWRVYLGNVTDLKLNVTSDNGDKCVLGIELLEKEYVTVVKECSGPTKSKIEEDYKKIELYIEGSNISKQKKAYTNRQAQITRDERLNTFYSEILKDNPYGFDVSLLGMSVNRQGINIAGIIVFYNGETFRSINRPIEVDMALGEKYRIKKSGSGDDTYKIMYDTELMFNSNTTDPAAVLISWPQYFLAQAENSSLKMYQFDTNKTVEFPNTERLSHQSNNLLLVTIDKIKENVLLRPISGLLKPEVLALSKQTLQLGSADYRVTSYEYSSQDLVALEHGLIFNRCRILPGSNSTKFGWYEHSYDLTTQESKRKLFNGFGQFINDVEREEEADQTSLDIKTVITDKTGQLPIVDVYPRNVSDEAVLYYGFEKYERTQLAEDVLWKFDDWRLYTDDGNRYLQLIEYHAQLEGSLRIRNPNETYIFSCWIRIIFQSVGDHIDFIKIALQNHRNETLRTVTDGVIQHKIDNWYYVELLIPESALKDVTFAKVNIAPQKYIPLDIDNIRFSPLNVDFKAFMYRSTSSVASAVLNNNGLVTQNLFDSNGNKVVYFTEQGQITDFITYSKLYLVNDSKKLPQVMELKPTHGVYDVLDSSSLFNNWEVKDVNEWETNNGHLIHKSPSQHVLSKKLTTASNVLGVRFLYTLDSASTVIQIAIGDLHLDVLCKSTEDGCRDMDDGISENIPDFGEIVVLITKLHKAIWIEGRLIYEAAGGSSDMSKIKLAISGSVKISEFIMLHDPSVKITYYNLLGLPKQTLFMHDQNSIRIREIIYDEIDRPIITTKWTIVERSGDLMFGYYENFITTVESAQLNGLVHQYSPDCEGFPYFRKSYTNSPTSESSDVSLPGKLFSQDRKYYRHFARKSNIKFLDELFPPEEGFTQEVEIRQDITVHVTLKDKQNRKTAYFVKVGDFDQRLTTYQYNGDKVVLELPPAYHQLADTFNRKKSFNKNNFSGNELDLQAIWGNHNTYDSLGRLTSKKTPDSGTQKYFYDENNIVRFMVYLNKTTADKIVYFSYGPTGKIVKEAVVKLDYHDLDEFMVNSTHSPDSTNFVEYYHGEFDPSPSIRHRSQQSVRRLGNNQMMESLIFDENDKISKKIFVVPALNTSYSIDYEYTNGKLAMIRYPIDVNGNSFELAYGYNSAGDVTSIGTSTIPDHFAKLQYNADGMVKTIQFEPESPHSYIRQYDYNEPGYLKTIKDDFLEETISYLEGDGYGSIYAMILEGLISKTSFTANWYNKGKPSLSQLRLSNIVASGINEANATVCLNSLIKSGYLNSEQRPLKSLYTEIDDTVGETCRSSIFRKLFLEHSFPLIYGHSYDYDCHEQLVKAKYFQNRIESTWKPLVETSFSSWIPELSMDNSKAIWKILTQHGFISQSCINPGMCEGNPGRSLTAKEIPENVPVQAILLNAIANRRSIAEMNFVEKCLQWSQNINCSEMWMQLLIHNFVGAYSKKTINALNPLFREALSSFSEHLPEIVQVLHQHFATRLGQSPGDVSSCLFDANGNHRLFYAGNSHYRFTYKHGTNQIETVIKSTLNENASKQSFNMEHNTEGSVTMAMHKGINMIEYDRLQNRASRITMNDGRTLLFEYDVRGERTFKQVLNGDGSVCMEKYYIRDLDGKVLVDMQMTFLTDDKAPDLQITSYIYSTSGLIGFVRNNEFYSVFTDHEGSVRLVIKDGEVMAAYDYLPYGHIFRKFGEDLNGSIAYLYTGQEWDEETGLYNYHSRLYDPEIGRFYQVDPKGQYASPYIYAGNSPVALMDPDGQFALTLLSIILALVGAYLGGASANGSWNPAEWNWKSGSTWLGIVGGALSGISMPYNMGSTLAYFTGLGLSTTTAVSIMVGTGIGFTYLSMAAANNDWDPSKWDMRSPETWNAFFSGVATTGWILTNPDSLISSYGKIPSALGRGFFVAGKIVLSGGFAYMYGVLSQNGEFDPSKWNFSKPGIYSAMFNGVTFATTVVKLSSNLPATLKGWKKQAISMLDRFDESVAFIRYNTHLGSDWSKQLSNVNYFLEANADGIKTFERGVLTVAFYSMITSLRITKSIEKSAVPEAEVVLNFISSISTTRGFSNKVIANLVPMSDSKTFNRISDPSELVSSARSGATRLFHKMFEYFRYNIPYRMEDPIRTVVNYSTKRTASPTGYTIPNCYQLVATEHGQSLIECYGHGSKTSIYLNHQRDSLAEDKYEQCYPMTYNNIPSVSCEGENSSLLFAAFEAPRMFDFVDGWILLMHVMPSTVRNIWAGLRHVFGGEEKIAHRHIVGEKQAARLLENLKDVSDVIRVAEVHHDLRWAKQLYINLEEDILEFIADKRRSWSMLHGLKERISALGEDVWEEANLQHATRSTMGLHISSIVETLQLNTGTSIGTFMHNIIGNAIPTNGKIQ